MNKDGPADATASPCREWLVVEVAGADESPAACQTVARSLFQLGGSAVEQLPGGVLRTWLRMSGAVQQERARVSARLATLLGHPDIRLKVEPDRDWLRAWRLGLGPRRVGRRIVISPSWTETSVASEDILIRLDPEMAFGTGEHGSTRTALRLLEEAVEPGGHVIDIGTGSGILAIAAARLGWSVVAVEADPEAVRTARRNVRANRVEDRVRVMHLRVDEPVLRLLQGSRWDVNVDNVDLGFTAPLLPSLRALAAPGGRFVVAGILAGQAEDLLAAARDAGLVLLRSEFDDGWWGGILTPSREAA